MGAEYDGTSPLDHVIAQRWRSAPPDMLTMDQWWLKGKYLEVPMAAKHIATKVPSAAKVRPPILAIDVSWLIGRCATSALRAKPHVSAQYAWARV